jgi:hypothetical protein
MKTLMFVTAVSILSATGGFAQGVMFDPNAPSPVYGPYPHSPDVGLFDQRQPAPQQSRRDTRRARQKGDQQSFRVELSTPTK